MSDTIHLDLKNGWHRLPGDETHAVEQYALGYCYFISQGKTERECHDLALAELQSAGAVELEPDKQYPPGTLLYRSWKRKALFAARIGSTPLEDGALILGAHIDSPRLDAKPVPLYEDGELALLDTHYYGGIRKYQWVSLPLAIHGTIINRNGESVSVSVGEDKTDPVFVITDLLPHLAKEQNKKNFNEGITGEGLNLLLGSKPLPESDDKDAPKTRVKQAVLQMLHTKYGMTEEDLISAELEIVPAGPARELGVDRSMILGYGQDDRVCAWAALQALLEADKTPQQTQILLLADKEEIGSTGATGMDSTFFENSVAELIAAAGQGESHLTLRRALANSRMISADVSVAMDPNYPDVNSPNNTGRLNYGVIISKYTGARGKVGASEGSAEFLAGLRRTFDSNGVFWQVGELGKVDLGGGGTIAKFLARYGMDVLDCGPGVLSMHGPWETVSKLDAYMTWKAYHAFLNS